MASSNRHWPSMFKSKLCNSHHQWQHHDISPFHHKNAYSSSSGCEERSPEPKPRWNPRPEQIRILEAIFNSGMVNPPRDEIRKIRAQLQEFGQVGDANVFYWFQNRKSRTKNKQRHLQGGGGGTRLSKPPTSTSSSSSSSEQSTGSDKTLLPQPAVPPPPPVIPMAYPHGPGPAELGGDEESLLLLPSYCQHQGHCFSAAPDATGVTSVSENAAMGVYPTGAWGEVLIGDDGRKLKMQLHHLYAAAAATAGAAAAAAAVPNASATVNGVNAAAAAAAGGATGFATPINELQVLEEGEGSGAGGGATAAAASSSKSIVFTGEAAFEVAANRVNVSEVFGGEAVLLDQSGQPVLTDEWGVTVHPLQHGASYYLV